MWHSRLPLFARLFASPDLGLSPHDWINVALTAGILIAASVQAFVAWRLWSLQHEIEKERKRVDLLVDFCWVNDRAKLKIASLTPFNVLVEKIELTLIQTENGSRGVGWFKGPIKLIPLGSEHVLDVMNALSDAQAKLLEPGPTKLVVVITSRAHGNSWSHRLVKFQGDIKGGWFKPTE